MSVRMAEAVVRDPEAMEAVEADIHIILYVYVCMYIHLSLSIYI